MLPRSSCEIGEAEPNIIIIVDKDDGLSITNDAEAVVQHLVDTMYGSSIDQHRIIYRDTQGRWDGMRTVDGRFAGFVMLGTNDRLEALQMARTRNVWA